jgi:small subunit ribosomal protein S8
MDYISDMISRIRNNLNKKFSDVIILNSKICLNILYILYRLGYINGFSILNKNYIKVYLKYSATGIPSIKQIKRISKQGNRIYCSKSYFKLNKNLLHNMNSNSNVFILTTNKGVITANEMLLYNCGGEILLYIT